MKQMLFGLYNELEVTKSESLAIADMIDNGNLIKYYDNDDNKEQGCLIGLVDIIRNTPNEHLDMIMTDYTPLELVLFHSPDHNEISQWVREYAEQC